MDRSCVSGQYGKQVKVNALLDEGSRSHFWRSHHTRSHFTSTEITQITFLVNDLHKLNKLVRQFWDVDDSKKIQVVKPEEKIARDEVAETLTAV